MQSPGYPEGYANNLKCEWIFTTTQDNHIVGLLTDFNLDGSSIGETCFGDNIQIYSGIDGTQEWSLLQKICTKNSSMKTFEASNLMKVVFETNAYLNSSGFSMDIFESN